MTKKAGKAPARSKRVENTCIDPGDATKGEIEILSEETVWENESACLLVADDVARRELKEEIGAEALEIFSLGRVVTDSGQQVGFPHIVAARIREGGNAEPEESEAIDGTFRYRYAELVAACERGEIVDSFTLAAVVRLRPHFETGPFVYRAGLVER